MAGIYPLTKDACSIVLGPRLTFSCRRGALEMLLFPEPGRRVQRVPLLKGRDLDAGDLTLSATGRTLQVRVVDPSRLFLGRAEDARAFLQGKLAAVGLTEATDNATGEPPAPAPEDAQERTQRLAEAARKMQERLGGGRSS